MLQTAAPPLLAGLGLPQFGAITAEQVEQAIPLLLEELHAQLTALEANLESRLAMGEAAPWAGKTLAGKS